MTATGEIVRSLPPAARAWLIGYAVIAIVEVAAEAMHAEWVAFAGTIAAMPALAFMLVAARPGRNRVVRLVVWSLVFSWLGDWVGDLIPPHVLVKIGFFFVAHLFFIAAFWPFRRRSILYRPAILVPYLVIIAGLLGWIAPATGELAVPVVIYGCALTTMGILATGLPRPAGLGAAIFILSDLSIAVWAFVYPGRFAYAEVEIMATYFVAQLLIVLGVIATSSAEVRSVRAASAPARTSPDPEGVR